MKNLTEFKCNYDIIYQGKSTVNGCNDHYLREIARRISERVLHQAGRDSNYHFLGNSVESGHTVLDINDKKIMDMVTKNMLENNKLLKRI